MKHEDRVHTVWVFLPRQLRSFFWWTYKGGHTGHTTRSVAVLWSFFLIFRWSVVLLRCQRSQHFFELVTSKWRCRSPSAANLTSSNLRFDLYIIPWHKFRLALDQSEDAALPTLLQHVIQTVERSQNKRQAGTCWHSVRFSFSPVIQHCAQPPIISNPHVSQFSHWARPASNYSRLSFISVSAHSVPLSWVCCWPWSAHGSFRPLRHGLPAHRPQRQRGNSSTARERRHSPCQWGQADVINCHVSKCSRWCSRGRRQQRGGGVRSSDGGHGHSLHQSGWRLAHAGRRWYWQAAEGWGWEFLEPIWDEWVSSFHRIILIDLPPEFCNGVFAWRWLRLCLCLGLPWRERG